MTLGERIKARRLELSLSLEDVAKLLKVNRSTIKRYEDGETKRIAQATIEKLAIVLNTTTGYLLGFDSDNKQDLHLNGEVLTLARDMQNLSPDDLTLLKAMVKKMADMTTNKES